MGDIEVVSASQEHWEQLSALFGKGGASNGCWCQYWLLGADYHRRDRSLNRDDLRTQVVAEQAGLVALRAGRAIGWARLTHRSALTYLTKRFSVEELAEDPLALSCFFVRGVDRGSGVMQALIGGAQDVGRRLGLPVEGYPIDAAAPGATRNRFAGVLSAFLRAGFVEVDRLTTDRALVRWRP